MPSRFPFVSNEVETPIEETLGLMGVATSRDTNGTTGQIKGLALPPNFALAFCSEAR